MDDKLIIFKENMILYITGSGPDATGANNGYSQTTFISSTVGCNNFLSIVLMPNGIIFQSDKGLWLLQRDLNLQYVGFPVQTYATGAKVLSASNVPNTNQVRFILDSGVTLMYDFFVNEWGTFSINAVSSTIWQGQHTWIASNGYVYKESPGSYLDYQTPVNMSFTTSWFNLAGLQGYQRAYYFYLLGTYISPHTLTLNISYDYSTSVNQTTVITPFNYNNSSTLEQYKVHLQRQTCQSLQISLTESYDNSYYPTPLTAGAGLTLSGLSIALGLKKGWRPIGQLQSVS
jgi:hypothetical protein